jgi:hypothetical protein
MNEMRDRNEVSRRPVSVGTGPIRAQKGAAIYP